jgi:hypothetical protein
MVSWSFGSRTIPELSTFEKRLFDYCDDEEDLELTRLALDATCIAAPRVCVVFEPWDPATSDRTTASVTVDAPNGRYFSGLELLHLVHNAIAVHLQQKDEGLERRQDEELPTYDAIMGS